jgi:hypothetical protein
VFYSGNNPSHHTGGDGAVSCWSFLRRLNVREDGQDGNTFAITKCISVSPTSPAPQEQSTAVLKKHATPAACAAYLPRVCQHTKTARTGIRNGYSKAK